MSPTDAPAPIVVATDLGEWGDAAVREADRWARETGAPLLALHVISPLYPVPPFGPGTAPDPAAMAERQRADAEALVARVGALTGRAPADVEAIIPVGTPHEEILRVAEARAAALVVVGARGSSGLARLLVGHSAERVARAAHCPVLVVRPSPASGHLVVATDLSETASAAVRLAGAVASRRSAALHALYVVDSATPFPIEPWIASDLAVTTGPALRQHAHEQLRAHLATLGVAAEAEIADGSVLDALIDRARAVSAELVVVGTVGRTGLARVLMGNTAEAAIRELPCSVLVVRGTP